MSIHQNCYWCAGTGEAIVDMSFDQENPYFENQPCSHCGGTGHKSLYSEENTSFKLTPIGIAKRRREREALRAQFEMAIHAVIMEAKNPRRFSRVELDGAAEQLRAKQARRIARDERI